MKEKLVDEKILKWFHAFCEKYSIEPELFDIQSEMDRTLTFGENISHIEPKLKLLIKPELLLTTADVSQLRDMEKQAIKAESDRVMQEFKKQKAVMVTTHKTDLLKDHLRMVVEKKCPCLLVQGRTGIGKTHAVINTLKEMGAEFEYMSGFSTPLALYQYMYDYRDKLLVLDDLEGLFSDFRAVSLLKAATGETNGKRIVSYNTTSKAAKDYPTKFEMKEGIVILCNEVNGNRHNENFLALLSRAIKYQMKLTHTEILDICNKILEQRKLNNTQKDRVLQIIKDNVTEASGFNLRELDKLIQCVEYNPEKSEELYLSTLDFDEENHLVLKLMRSELAVEQQVNKFVEETGMHRATFYRIKKKMKELMGENRKVTSTLEGVRE